VDDGTDFVFPGSTAAATSYWLRIRLEPDQVVVESSPDGDFWDVAQTYPRTRFPGSPSAVRLGKGRPGRAGRGLQPDGPPGHVCDWGTAGVRGGTIAALSPHSRSSIVSTGAPASTRRASRQTP